MRKLFAIVILTGILLLAGCGEDYLVSIGSGGVSSADMDQIVLMLGEQGERLAATPEGRQQLLDRALQVEVLYQSALGDGVDQLPDVQAQIRQATRDIIISNYLRIAFADYGYSEEELSQYYQQHQAELQTPAQANVRQIQLRTEAEAKAVLKELEGGADFSTLARERSLDTRTASGGGRLPAISQNDPSVPVALSTSIFAAEPGKPFGPVQSEIGWHVLVVDAFSPAQPLAFEDAKPQIIAALLAPEADVQTYYDAHKAEFDVPAGARLRWILVPDQAQAEQIVAEARSGKDFAALAKQYSTDPATKDSGGLIQRLYQGQPLPLLSGARPDGTVSGDAKAFNDAVFSLAPGEIGAPLQLERGWAIILVEALTPAQSSTFELVKAEAQRRLFQERSIERENNFYSELETKLGVTRNEEAISQYLQAMGGAAPEQVNPQPGEVQ